MIMLKHPREKLLPFILFSNAMGKLGKIGMIWILLSTLNFNYIQAQIDLDSISSMIENIEGNDEKSIDWLIEIANQIQNQYPEMTIVLANNALKMSVQLDYRIGNINASEIKAKVLARTGKRVEALDIYFGLLKDTNKLDSNRLVINHLNIAKVYRRSSGYYKAKHHYQKSLNYFSTEQTSPSYYGNIMNGLGEVYHFLGDTDSSLIYNTQALVVQRNIYDSTGLATSYHNLGMLYYRKLGDTITAIQQYLRAIDINKRIKDYAVLPRNYNNLGNIYADSKRYDLAEKNYNFARYYGDSSNSSGPGSYAVYLLSLIEEEQGNYQKSLEYRDQFFQLRNETLYNDRNSRMDELNAVYNLFQKEKELIEANKELAVLNREKELANIKTALFVLAIVSIIIVASLIIYLQRQKGRKELKLKEVQTTLHKAELENSKLREQELTKELEFKNRELTTFTLNFIQKNELIGEIKTINTRLIEECSKLGINSTIMGGLKRVSQIVKNNQNYERDWEEFKTHFENVHKDFFVHLKSKFPSLTSNELNLCAMIRMNRNVKETASLTGISPDSIKKARYRLRKKFSLATEDNLMDFLIIIETGESLEASV